MCNGGRNCLWPYNEVMVSVEHLVEVQYLIEFILAPVGPAVGFSQRTSDAQVQAWRKC